MQRAAEDERWVVEPAGPFDKANLGAKQGGLKGALSMVAKRFTGKALAGKALLVEGITVRQQEGRPSRKNCDAVRLVVGCGHWPTKPSLSMAREVITKMQEQVKHFGTISAQRNKDGSSKRFDVRGV